MKSHTGEVLITILIVNFFKLSFSITYGHPTDLLLAGGGIVMVAVAMLITHYIGNKREPIENGPS